MSCNGVFLDSHKTGQWEGEYFWTAMKPKPKPWTAIKPDNHKTARGLLITST